MAGIVNPQLAAMCRKGEAVAGVIFREAETLQLRIRKITECHFPLILPLHSPQIIHGLVFQDSLAKGVKTIPLILTGDTIHHFSPPFRGGGGGFSLSVAAVNMDQAKV